MLKYLFHRYRRYILIGCICDQELCSADTAEIATFYEKRAILCKIAVYLYYFVALKLVNFTPKLAAF